MSNFDQRGPMVVELRELGRHPGSQIAVERTVPAPESLGSGVAVVATGSPLRLDVRLQTVLGGVLASGAAKVVVNGECARCLSPVSWDQRVTFTELFLDEPDPDDEELPILAGDFLNLESVVRDAVVLALPLAPLCTLDCLGLCVDCGARLSEDSSHTHESLDPRWAGLAGFENNKKED